MPAALPLRLVGAVAGALLLLGTAACGSPVIGERVETSAPKKKKVAEESAAERVPASVLVAYAKDASTPVYAERGSSRPLRTLASPNRYKTVLTLLVTKQSGSWVEVLLPVRPTPSRGWVRKADVTLTPNAYRLVVDVSERTITAYKGGKQYLRDTVAVGMAQNPTPIGLASVTALLQPPDPKGEFGTHAYVLSAFSPTLTKFLGGPGSIGIHGTNRPDLLGKAVSHGCVRVKNSTVDALAKDLPLGTPVELRA